MAPTWTLSQRQDSELSETTPLRCWRAVEDARGMLAGVEDQRRPLRLHPTTWFAGVELAVSLLQLEPHRATAELREVQTRASFGFLEFSRGLAEWQVELFQPRWGWGWQRALRALLPAGGAATQLLLAALLADDAWTRCNQASLELRIRAGQPSAPLLWAAAGAAEVRQRARLIAALRHAEPTTSQLAWELGFEIDCPPEELLELAIAAAMP